MTARTRFTTASLAAFAALETRYRVPHVSVVFGSPSNALAACRDAIPICKATLPEVEVALRYKELQARERPRRSNLYDR